MYNPQKTNLNKTSQYRTLQNRHKQHSYYHKQERRHQERHNQQQQQGFANKFTYWLNNFNLCLRPQKQSQQLTEYLNNFQLVSLYQDPYYGECYAVRSIDQGYYVAIRKQKWYKKQHKQRVDELQNISKYAGSDQNILSFDIISQIQKRQFLFTKIQMYIAFDFILIDLEKEFQNRIIYKRIFTESQINIMMKECCTGLVALQNTNYRSVRMSYIYFCQNGKQIKIAHPAMFKYKTNLQVIKKKPKTKGVYLSPEELILLEKNQTQYYKQSATFKDDQDFMSSSMPNNHQSYYNSMSSNMPNNNPNYYNKGQSSNSFTFGMVILSLMCNKYLNQIYDYRTCQIHYLKIKELLHNLTNVYSERLVKIVENLLKPKLEERLTLRSLLNLLEEKYQLSERVEITLLKEKLDDDSERNYGYRPLFQQEMENPNPHHKNYLYGMVYPKVGIQGEYYHFDQKDPFRQQDFQNGDKSGDLDQNIIANHRYAYTNLGSKYIGDSLERDGIGQKPLKQGKGIYMLENGQSYFGEWKNNEMHGYGKLYWPGKKIRYEGEFQNGQFNGFGTEYAQRQIPDRQDQIDKTFVRIHKGSWLKYEGRFKNDKKEGPGKAFFKNGKWIGNFKKGQPWGNGVWQGSDGQKYKGVWNDGYLAQDR